MFALMAKIANGTRPTLADFVEQDDVKRGGLSIRDMVEQCLHQDATARPTFADVLAGLDF